MQSSGGKSISKTLFNTYKIYYKYTSSTTDDESHQHAKEAEKTIKHLLDQIVASNDDQAVTIPALDILHKLISKYQYILKPYL